MRVPIRKDWKDSMYPHKMYIRFEFRADRKICVKFGNIIDCINRSLGLEVNDSKLDKTCGIGVQDSIQKN